MANTRPRQLELPVMVDVNRKAQAGVPSGQAIRLSNQSSDAGFHKPASAEDQSVYKAISDKYFKATAKQT